MSLLSSPRVAPRTALALLVIASIVPYFPALGGDFVVDDVRFVRDNGALSEPDVFRRAFTDPTVISSNETGPDWGGVYRPLRTIAFALERRVSGGAPWFHHLSGLIWHALASVVAYGLLKRLLESHLAALFGATIFALHPGQVESVAWITSRGDVMAGALSILTVHLCLRRDRLGWVLGAVAFVGALLAKESAIVVPLLLALILAWRPASESRLRAARRAVPLVVVAIVYLVVRAAALGGAGDAAVGHRDVPWGETALGALLTMSRAGFHYAQTLFLPANLAYGYHVPQPRAGEVPVDAVVLLAIWAGLLALAVRSWRRGGIFGLGFLWIVVSLLPVSNLVVTINIPSAERFLYLPMVGFALMAAAFVSAQRGRSPARARQWTAGAAAVLVLLAFLTLSRSADWRTETTVWAATIHDPVSGHAGGTVTSHQAPYHFAYLEYEVGKAAVRGEDFDEAARRFDEALRLARLATDRAARFAGYRGELYWPRGPWLIARTQLELARHCGRDVLLDAFDQAEEVARRSGMRFAPGHAVRGRVAFELGLYEEAARSFAIANRIAPHVPQHRFNLMTALNKAAVAVDRRGARNATLDAWVLVSHSLALDSDPATNADGHQLREQLEARFRRAAEETLRAARRAGADPERWLGFVFVYATFGRFDLAEETLDRIQGDRPPSPEIEMGRAWILRLRGGRENLEKARAIHDRLRRGLALPATGPIEIARNHAALAESHADAGDWDSASAQLTFALEILETAGEVFAVEALELRARLLRRLGDFHQRAGRTEQGRAAWRASAQSYEALRDRLGPEPTPRRAGVHRNLAVLLLELGDPADAATALRRYLEAWGDAPPTDVRWAKAMIRRLDERAQNSAGE